MILGGLHTVLGTGEVAHGLDPAISTVGEELLDQNVFDAIILGTVVQIVLEISKILMVVGAVLATLTIKVLGLGQRTQLVGRLKGTRVLHLLPIARCR